MLKVPLICDDRRVAFRRDAAELADLRQFARQIELHDLAIDQIHGYGSAQRLNNSPDAGVEKVTFVVAAKVP